MEEEKRGENDRELTGRHRLDRQRHHREQVIESQDRQMERQGHIHTAAEIPPDPGSPVFSPFTCQI